MKKLIIKSTLLVAIMTLSLCTFAQIGTSGPVGPTEIFGISIPKNGCQCPSSGVVTSDWYWMKGIYFTVIAGTSFYYYDIPAAGSVSCAGEYGSTASKVHLTIWPGGGTLGVASKLVDFTLHTTVIRPSACVPPGVAYDCPLDTD